MPISTTTKAVVRSARRSVAGTPSSLFWLPAVATVGPAAARTARMRFFVVVLPLEPVTASTLPAISPRQAAARSVIARKVSGTRTMPAPAC